MNTSYTPAFDRHGTVESASPVPARRPLRSLWETTQPKRVFRHHPSRPWLVYAPAAVFVSYPRRPSVLGTVLLVILVKQPHVRFDRPQDRALGLFRTISWFNGNGYKSQNGQYQETQSSALHSFQLSNVKNVL